MRKENNRSFKDLKLIKKINHADVLLLFVAIIWGGGFIVTKTALDVVPPFFTMAFRFPIAALFLGLMFFKRLKFIDKKLLKGGLITGIFLFLAFAFQTLGINYTTASKNAFLTATSVVLVPYILWIMFKKKPNKYQIISSLMCIVGIGLITINSGDKGLEIGDILSIVCAGFFSIHIICLDYFSKKLDIVLLTIIQLATAGVISIFFATNLETLPKELNFEFWKSIFYLGVVSTLLAYLIQTYAQKHTTASKTSLILSTEAVFAAIFSIIYLGENLSISMITGCIIVFISIALAEMRFKNKKYDKEKQVE